MNDSTWTWVSGTNIANHPGVYVEKGVPNKDYIPRARRGAVGWYDSLKEEFWLFGGTIAGYQVVYVAETLNDLWRYRISDNTWTWMGGSNTPDQPGVYGEKGVASSENIPDARCCGVTWFDNSQRELWLFGGYNLFGMYCIFMYCCYNQ